MIEISDNLFDQIAGEAKKSPRKRKNYNFHKVPSDTLQRMIHAMEPGTYVQPHKHVEPDKREVFLIFKGKVAAVEYDDMGNVEKWCLLEAGGPVHGVEMTTRAWHNLIAIESSVIYEIKDGPYDPADDKYFAEWAPREDEPGTVGFNEKVLRSLGLK
jgi:cupin fold WbuC family metalloprotein